jgi:hypothetical protein
MTAGRRTGGHPIHTDMCAAHGVDLYRFCLWLSSDALGGPDESFDVARAWWHRTWLSRPV